MKASKGGPGRASAPPRTPEELNNSSLGASRRVVSARRGAPRVRERERQRKLDGAARARRGARAAELTNVKKRRDAALLLFNALSLASASRVDLEQADAYGAIILTRGPKFDA